MQITVATSGKAVTFSGLAVAVGLSGLLLFQPTALRSFGIGGALVVGSSVFYALTFLPAVLGMLGPRVNALSVAGLRDRIRRALGRPVGEAAAAASTSRWERVAHWVMARPVAVLIPTLAFLLILGTPFLRLAQGIPDASVLPPGIESREASVALSTDFQAGETSPIVVLATVVGSPTDEANVERILALSAAIDDVDHIDRVERPFAGIKDPQTGGDLDAAGISALFGMERGLLPPEMAAGLDRLEDTYIRGSTVRLDAVSPLAPLSPQGTGVVPAVRAVRLDGVTTQVGGLAADGHDFMTSQSDTIPYAIMLTLGASAIILFLLFGSVVIPIKAVIMTLLSITASFGALVFIFQEGHFADVLGFTTPGFTIAGNPIIMFSVLFGLSMDYEVLLLSRIQEAYRRTGDNTASVAEGLAKTAGVITGAALIMVTVFAAFALAESITIKSIGVGMAIAVLIDATIVRVLLVPATMRLMGRWNWWAPGPLRRFADRLGFDHVEDEPVGRRRRRRLCLRGTLAPSVDERPGTVTRLGPDSGGRPPDVQAPGGQASGDPDVRMYSWEWGTGRLGRDQDRRPGLPWFGIFLLVFGGLLLIQQLYPQSQAIGSVLMLAIGIAFLIRWAVTRGTGSLYAGAIITALAVPNALDNAGLSRDGLGTFSLGIAFLFIALVRAVGGGGVGWQALFGGLLALVGAVNLIQPEIGGLIVPIALVVAGAILVFGGLLGPDRRPWGNTR